MVEVNWLRTVSNGHVIRFIMDAADGLNSICSREILFPLISIGHWMYYNRCKYLNWVPHWSLQSPWSVSNLAFLIIAYRNVARSIIPRIVCGWFCPRAVMTPGHSRRLSHGPPHTLPLFFSGRVPCSGQVENCSSWKPSWNQTLFVFVFVSECKVSKPMTYQILPETT
jgi:hypothetical protein